MQCTIRLQCVHRNRLFRECLAQVLSQSERLEVATLDPTAGESIRQIQQHRSAVVLIDLELPQGQSIDLIRQIRSAMACVKIVVMAGANHRQQIMDSIVAGAHGFVLDQASLPDLQTAIDRVMGGQRYCSPEILESVFKEVAARANRSVWQQRAASVPLTRREREILALVGEGLSNKEIAKRLFVSLYTVKNHVHNILDKMQVNDRREAAEMAYASDWFDAPSAAHGTMRA